MRKAVVSVYYEREQQAKSCGESSRFSEWEHA